MIEIDVSHRQSRVPCDESRFRIAVQQILLDAGITAASVSLCVVDDPQIHVLNREYLAHDYPTDVLSFLFEREGSFLSGEVIVSADTAAATATRFGWTADDELLLYIIHGTLHLVGYDDLEPAAQAEMRARERHYLRAFQLEPHYDE